MRLKEIILMLENDYCSFKKGMKNQEMVNLCRKNKKVEGTVSSKRENLEKYDNIREKNYANGSELRNKSVIIDMNSASDGYVQLSSEYDNASIKHNNDSRSHMEKIIVSESLPFFEVESLRGKKKYVGTADINDSSSPRKRFKCSDCVCCLTSETSFEDDKRKKSGSTQSSKDKSEAEEVELNDGKYIEKENESDDKESSGVQTKSDKSGKSNPRKEELRITIRDIVEKVDLNTAIFTDILKRLCFLYKTDLTPRKTSIKLMIQEELTKLADEIESSEESSEEEIDYKPKIKKARV